MRPIVIYHGNCADGFAAAWCFWRKYKDSYDYYPGVYQSPPPDVTGRDVYLVDFSYKREVVADMLRVAKTVTLIDHHKTAIEDLASLDGLQQFISLEHSGAVLAWKFLNDEPAPRLLLHIEDRDLWRFKLQYTKAIQSNLFSYPYDFEVWDNIISKFDGQDYRLKFAAAGEAIERKLHKDVAELVKVCQRPMSIGGYDGVPTASLPYTYVSEAAHLMATEAPFAACYWDTPTGRVFGLRSTDNGIDVSEIAKQYGGGGHKHAAGFTVPRWHHLAVA